jgi:N-acetylmuramoyl-L-alanine amidase
LRRYRWSPSPNIGARRDGRRPDLLILHYTGMASAEAACNWLCDPASGVSCHYLVDEAGEVTQMVEEEMRAWHAGVSSWEGVSDINSRSIGIEIHNPGPEVGYPDFPLVQMASVARLAHDIIERHAIRPWHVLAHSDVAPGRKIDPGEKFDWKGLAAAGVGIWVEPDVDVGGASLQPGDEGDTVSHLQARLARFGYGIAVSGSYEAQTRTVISALQRHFRPAQVDGIADGETQAVLGALLAVSGKEGRRT